MSSSSSFTPPDDYSIPTAGSTRPFEDDGYFRYEHDSVVSEDVFAVAQEAPSPPSIFAARGGLRSQIMEEVFEQLGAASSFSLQIEGVSLCDFILLSQLNILEEGLLNHTAVGFGESGRKASELRILLAKIEESEVLHPLPRFDLVLHLLLLLGSGWIWIGIKVLDRQQ